MNGPGRQALKACLNSLKGAVSESLHALSALNRLLCVLFPGLRPLDYPQSPLAHQIRLSGVR
jgi:hypothetical protein